MIYELFGEIKDCDEREGNSEFSSAFLNAFLHTM